MSPVVPLFNVRLKDTAETLDELDVALLDVHFLGFHCEVLEGEVTLIVNSSVRKEYPIPSQRPFMPAITSMITNGVATTFSVGQGGVGGSIPLKTNQGITLP